jgi:hypothetical protein
MKFCLLLCGLLACPSQASGVANPVGAFSKNDFSGWEEKSFSGHTTFAVQARMIAVDSGSENAGKWVRHRRNVRDDLKAALGVDFTEAHVVAIMTDGDNSGMEACAWYGDISFSSR